ncbi:MAG: YfiR family protein, partial [Terriglobales bacterium]
RWQADRTSLSESLDICILGKDPFGAVLDSTIAGESIDGRKITVRRIARVQEAVPCSILFIGTSEASRLTSILTAAQHFNALTVSDLPHFAEQGGMIGFVTQEGRIRFDVNRAAAEQSHLTLSSELLKVATKVIEKPLPRS